MTGLKTRSADYQALRGGPVTSMADAEKNGGVSGSGAVVTQQYAQPGPGGRAEATGGRSTRCGWGPFSPDACQRFLSPAWFLLWLSLGGAMQGLVVNGFVNVVISTLERRFEISSTESGTIASCYDIAAVICLIPVSYFGGRGRKPLYLGIGFFILGVGSFIFSIPHFTTPLYEGGDDEQLVCVAGSNQTVCTSGTRSLSDYKYVFFLGQLLHGVGATPLYTLGTIYLDENLPVRSSAVYQGAFYACAIIGPALGYLFGGVFLDIYTDFDTIDTSTLSISKENPTWVGAWWLGFLISGTIGFLISIPMCGFPVNLPGSDKYRAEREAEVYQTQKKDDSEDQPLGLRDIWVSFKALITNPTFMFLNLAAACEGLMVSGFSTFAPKFIEYQFGLSSGVAAMYVGLAAIPAGGGATFFGGYLVKRCNLSVRGILKFCVGVSVLAFFLSVTFLIHCPYESFVGVNVNASGATISADDHQLYSTCNTDCGCTMDRYFPVCGKDGLMYYSPCFAGCLSQSEDFKYYSNCSCIEYQLTPDEIASGSYWLAQEGKCQSDCMWLPVFLPVLAVLMVTIFITSMPALAATLRCVPQNRRSFGLGIQWIIARCLGSIPGPILFGKIIDLTCLLWQESCNGEGACFFYDKQQMSYNLLAVALAGTFMSIVCFFCALFFYRTGLEVPDIEQEVEPPGAKVDSTHTSLTNLSPAGTPATTPNSEHLPSL